MCFIMAEWPWGWRVIWRHPSLDHRSSLSRFLKSKLFATSSLPLFGQLWLWPIWCWRIMGWHWKSHDQALAWELLLPWSEQSTEDTTESTDLSASHVDIRNTGLLPTKYEAEPWVSIGQSDWSFYQSVTSVSSITPRPADLSLDPCPRQMSI